MSDLYDNNHRRLQVKCETEKLADVIETKTLHGEILEKDKIFIQSRDMFFLSTIDAQGRPTVSYKGGDPGFIKVINETSIAFPSYDGNGMFLSMGNIIGNSQVGLLFIDFENPYRLRLQGEASIDYSDPLLQEYQEADLIVRVAITQIWQNCPRYIHKYQKQASSKYTPRQECETPLPDWKRINEIQPLLKPRDQEKVKRSGGPITVEEFERNNKK
jgi:predicted pyridoxine 5'-phosphate oxidase superfamily flavin-nucleotide-binding protein